MDSKTMKIEVSQAEFKRIEDIMAQATAEFIKELPDMVKQRLQGAVAKILGFENRWHEWEIDHCNGRMSVMSEYIGQKAKDAARAAAADLEFKPTKEMKAAIHKEYTEKFMYALRQQLEDAATKHVKEMLAEAAKQHEIEIETLTKIPTKKELSDPAYGKRPMEKLIMETLAGSNAKVEEK